MRPAEPGTEAIVGENSAGGVLAGVLRSSNQYFRPHDLLQKSIIPELVQIVTDRGIVVVRILLVFRPRVDVVVVVVHLSLLVALELTISAVMAMVLLTHTRARCKSQLYHPSRSSAAPARH